MAIRGVLVDVDGTLVLSNEAQARAWTDAFNEFDIHVPVERVEPLIGMGGDKLIPQVANRLNAQEGEGKALSDRRKQIFLERYAPSLQPAPGARELIERLRAAHLRLIIATSAKPDELQVLLRAAQVDDLIADTEVTTADDASQSKPAPDIVQVALSRIELPPSEVVMIGDAPYDIESAGRVHVGAIALRSGGYSDEQLRGALAIYTDPADLVEHFDASPLGNRQGS